MNDFDDKDFKLAATLIVRFTEIFTEEEMHKIAKRFAQSEGFIQGHTVLIKTKNKICLISKKALYNELIDLL